MTDELGHVFELDHFELVLISRHVYEQLGVFWANLIAWIILALSRKKLEESELHEKNCRFQQISAVKDTHASSSFGIHGSYVGGSSSVKRVGSPWCGKSWHHGKNDQKRGFILFPFELNDAFDCFHPTRVSVGHLGRFSSFAF